MTNAKIKMPKVWVGKIGDWFHILVCCQNGSSITRAKNKEIDKIIYTSWNKNQLRPFDTREDAEKEMGKVLQILNGEKEEKVKGILLDVMQKLEKAYEIADLDDRILKIMKKVEDLM